MKELLQIELLKIKNYTVFRAFALLFIILVPLIFWSVGRGGIPFAPKGTAFFGFPDVWTHLTYITSFCMIFPALLIIVLVCNDITYKTQKQNVIDGLSKKEVILSKFLIVLMFSLFITAFVFLIGLLFGLIYSSVENVFNGISALLFFSVQTFGYLTLALLIAVLLRKTSLAVMAYLVIFFIAGIVLKNTISPEIAQLSPINMLNDLAPFPFFKNLLPTEQLGLHFGQGLRMIFGMIYVALFLLLSNFIMKKRDL